MYQVEVQVQTLRVPDWISRYCQPERFVPLCSACPQYGKNWACPPGMPQVERIAGAYSFVQVIGLKVLYDEAVRIAALTSPERTEEMRRKTYGAAKKADAACIACPGGRVSRFHDDHGGGLRAVSAVCQGRRKALQASKGDAIFLFRSRI